MKLFSKRNKPSTTTLSERISDISKSRILSIFRDHCHGSGGGFDQLLVDVGDFLFKQYGYLRKPAYEAARMSDHPVIEHFFCSDTALSIDFIEACFQQLTYSGGQNGVNEVNEVFLDENIGFELTPYVEHFVEKEDDFFGRLQKRTFVETEYPKVILRKQNFLHEEITHPALQLLSDQRLKVANSEMLQAHISLKISDYSSAITLSGSAFESFLKTICEINGWQYDSQRDTCSKLVKRCKDEELFPAFYAPLFESVGTIRNKLSNAHGRGPTNSLTVTREHAEHMIHVTSSHMLFLAKLADLG